MRPEDALFLLPRARRPARARVRIEEPALLGRRRARQRLRRGLPRLPNCADRHPGATPPGRPTLSGCAAAGARGGVLPRRRWQPRATSTRGSTSPRCEGAAADRAQQQPVGDLGAARAEPRTPRWRRRRSPPASRGAGRRQRPRRGAPRRPRRRSPRRAPAVADHDRGGHLPPRRPHHRRRRLATATPRWCRSSGPSSRSPACATTWSARRLGPEKEEALARECAETVTAAVEAYLSTPPPTTAAMLSTSLRPCPPRSRPSATRPALWRARTAGGQPGGDHG